MKTSKIATIVYKNYTENVDMLNPLFKQPELDALIKNDSDIVRVDYYVNGQRVLIGKEDKKSKKYSNVIIELLPMNECIINGIVYEYRLYLDDEWLGNHIYATKKGADGRSRIMLKVL